MNPAQVTYGPVLIGAFLNVFLFGIAAAQILHYFTTYKKDCIWIKAYVVVLAVADLLNSIFDIYWLYADLVTNFGNDASINVADWRVATNPAMIAIIAIYVQLFFAWRVQVLTNSWCVTGLVVLTAVVSCCGGLDAAVTIHHVKYYSNFYKLDPAVTVWLISTAFCDSAIAIALTWHLVSRRCGEL
ncbi:uncharacterized protein PHACADRAFT_177877 [Phanerochaete carnosa HHB-10118-sp]|uniref:Uncharacterized protein n=1 Tax=Phanerochaete carnosa (strain HHB-10118-sp) TaxID=650164 RepID=K5UN98_PHACS|nr:uncharacterized protein PHACADRAFT_177877 [Phanerochaete carnosa HHB-10118-sp]EKM51211.1 hypothetical protein PHACADRAFT_177877 [Phanerochaete carnosa HHB-10118-sp]